MSAGDNITAPPSPFHTRPTLTNKQLQHFVISACLLSSERRNYSHYMLMSSLLIVALFPFVIPSEEGFVARGGITDVIPVWEGFTKQFK